MCIYIYIYIYVYIHTYIHIHRHTRIKLFSSLHPMAAFRAKGARFRACIRIGVVISTQTLCLVGVLNKNIQA